MRIITNVGYVAIVGVVLSYGVECFGGTSREKALAAIAITRAFLEIADERPLLPDVPKPIPHQQSGASLQTDERPQSQSSESRRDVNRGTWQPMRCDFVKGPPIQDVLPAQLVITVWKQGCPACVRLKREIESRLVPLHWTVGSTSSHQIRFLEVPLTEAVPQLTLFQNGKEIQRWQGYQDPAVLSRELRRAWDSSAPLPTAAKTGWAGAISARPQIEAAMQWWRQQIGEGCQVQFRWTRTNAAQSLLLAKEAWSVSAVFGESGELSMAAPGASGLPVQKFGFRYRTVGDDLEVDVDKVTIANLAARWEPVTAREGDAGVPLQRTDPLSAWSVLSLLHDIGGLLNTSCDLQLGNTVSATLALNKDLLSIDFDAAPSIKIAALFTFSLQIKRVEITESSIKLIFGDSWFVKERTFQVQ